MKDGTPEEDTSVKTHIIGYVYLIIGIFTPVTQLIILGVKGGFDDNLITRYWVCIDSITSILLYPFGLFIIFQRIKAQNKLNIFALTQLQMLLRKEVEIV